MHISGTRFETPDPDAILELSGGTLSGLALAAALLVALALLLASSLLFRLGLRRYASASS